MTFEISAQHVRWLYEAIWAHSLWQKNLSQYIDSDKKYTFTARRQYVLAVNSGNHG